MLNEEDPNYSLQDLRVGSTLAIGGRDILIYDADEMTKRFFKDEFGTGLKRSHAVQIHLIILQSSSPCPFPRTNP